MKLIEKEQFQDCRRRIYDKIIDIFDKTLTHGYKKAVLGCFYIDRSPVPSLRLYYIIDNSNEYTNFIFGSPASGEVIYDLTDLCEDLQYTMRKHGSRWTAFTFVRERVGRFRAKFGYEMINNVNHMFLVEWRSKYF